jgi:hypothetical protein
MTTKSTQKSSTTLLILLLVIITFPIWIGFFAAAAGIVGGVFGTVFGAIFGTIGALVSGLVSLITWPINMIFGHGNWFPHFNGYTVAVIVLVIYLISKSKK